MQPWIYLDSTTVPGGETQLRLMQRGEEFSIMLDTNELMNSRLSGSEEALAELVSKRIASRPNPKILIGGLGMGFTLRAALKDFTADTAIVVAELVPNIVTWAKGPLSTVFGDCLSDPRLSIAITDVGNLIAASKNSYDAILLDVDNGPDGVSREQNNRIYQNAGLRHAWSALRPGGVLAVWSSGPSPKFTQRLRSAGFETEEVKVRARKGGRGARHVIWLAVKGR